MKRVGPLSLEGWLLFLFVGVVILGVTTCNARRDGRRAERVAQLERNAYKSTLAGIAARRSTDSLSKIAIALEHKVIVQVSNNRKVMARLSETLAANDSLLGLPVDSSDVITLRLQLAKTTEVARLFRDSTQVLLSTVLFSISAQDAERQAWLAERESNLILVAAKDKIIRELRESEKCRILFLPCPSRVQAVLIGSAGTLALLLLL